MNQEQVTEELVRQNGNQAAAVMADYVGQGGGDQPTPTPTPPSYTPNPRFDIDTILSGFPLSDKKEDERYIGDALGCPLDIDEFIPFSNSGITLLGSYYYSGPSEDLSLPVPFTAGNYACFAHFYSIYGYLYMAPVETMAYKEVALLEYDGDNKVWNVIPVN